MGNTQATVTKSKKWFILVPSCAQRHAKRLSERKNELRFDEPKQRHLKSEVNSIDVNCKNDKINQYLSRFLYSNILSNCLWNTVLGSDFTADDAQRGQKTVALNAVVESKKKKKNWAASTFENLSGIQFPLVRISNWVRSQQPQNFYTRKWFVLATSIC